MYGSVIETTEEKKENMRNKFSLSDLVRSWPPNLQVVLI